MMLLGAMLIYGSIGIFRKFIPLSSAVLACFRGFSGALLLVALVKLKRRKIYHGIGLKKVLGLVISGILIGFNWILLFEAYNYTTVPVATLCYYMQPTIVVLLSPLLFRERLTLKKGVCALVSVIGMVFISGIVEGGVPAFGDLKGILCGLGAACLYATVIIMNKKLPGIDAYEKTIIQLASAAIILVPYILVTDQKATGSITPLVIILLLIVGFVHTGIAYALYFGSMDGLKSQTVAIFSYLDPITALVLSAVILHETLSIYGIIGAILILGAAFISER